MSNDLNAPTASPDRAVWNEFVQAADVFCRLVQSYSNGGDVSLETLRRSLLTLYAAAVHTSPSELIVTTGGLLPKEPFRAEARSLMQRLTQRLPVNYYRNVFAPLDDECQAIDHSLADDLTDIWVDLKPGIDRVQSAPGRDHPEVWWFWRYGFEIHWGRHAISALRALHEVLQDI